MVEFALLCAVVVLAFFFSFTNGFQDGSSVCAGALTSRAMTPGQAISLVASCEMAGAIFGGSAVALAMQSITDWPARPDLLPVLISALIAAISWNFITRRLKVPSSSTHALVGGIVGALYAAGGASHINWGVIVSPWEATGVSKVVLALLLSPLLGFLAGLLVYTAFVIVLMRTSMRINKPLQQFQWIATAALAFGHGSNDPQKAMAMIMLALHAAGYSSTEIPIWVRLGCGTAIALGVVSLAPAIVQRVGHGIFRLRNFHAVCEETASALIVIGGSITGGPVSASQVISSTVVGVGSAIRPKRLQWLVVRDMVVAWGLTIPCSGLLAFALHGIAVQWLYTPVK